MVTVYEIYQDPTLLIVVLSLLILWSFIWKGIALWFSGKNRQKGWFIALLILNTAGILPLIYLIWFKPKDISVMEEKEDPKPKKKQTKKKDN